MELREKAELVVSNDLESEMPVVDEVTPLVVAAQLALQKDTTELLTEVKDVLVECREELQEIKTLLQGGA